MLNIYGQILDYVSNYKNASGMMQPFIKTNLNHSWLTQRDLHNQ